MTLAPTALGGPLLASYDAADCLIYGIGNVARRDDGLGWAFVDRVEASGRCAAATLARTYQLQLEDADLFSRFARVLVVDATRHPTVASWRLERPAPAVESRFTSHALSLPTVLAIGERCFGDLPEVTLLAIRGHAWDLRTGLTTRAARHLADALTALTAEESLPAPQESPPAAERSLPAAERSLPAPEESPPAAERSLPAPDGSVVAGR